MSGKHLSSNMFTSSNENRKKKIQKGARPTYQMQDINADHASILAFNCHQKHISHNIRRRFVIHYFLPVGVLEVDSFTSNLSRLRRRRIVRNHLYSLIQIFLKNIKQKAQKFQ